MQAALLSAALVPRCQALPTRPVHTVRPVRTRHALVAMRTDPVVVTSASIVINAPIGRLFTAYANLSRMTEWSPLLETVVFDRESGESDWALWVPRSLLFLARAAGVARPAVTWRAQIVQERPPALLQWRSLSGIENAGSAEFEEVSSGGVNMTLCLRYPLPGGVRVLVESQLVQNFVQRTMRGTMVRFAEVMVMEREAGEQQQLSASCAPGARGAGGSSDGRARADGNPAPLPL